jgi:tetratricopeptide (TPR) repeat protein
MDSTNFTCAIAVTDNTGFYEEDQKNKKAINSLMQDILMDGKVDFDTKNRDANAPLTPVDPYEKAISFMEWGENLMSMNNYKAAENNFLKAETNFLESGKTKNIYYAKLLTDLGLPYSALGNSEKANQSYYWGAFILTEN